MLFFARYLWTGNCFAQEISNFQVESLIGPSIPMGNFADKNYTEVTNSSGLAKTGFSVDANFKYSLSKNVGMQLSCTGFFNKQYPDP